MMNFRENNYLYLFLGIIFYLVAAPLAEVFEPHISILLVQFTFFALLIISVWSLSGNRKHYAFGWALTAVGFVLLLLYMVYQQMIYIILIHGVVFIFCILSFTFAVKDVFTGGAITTNRLLGSACTYMLLGIIWANLYYFADIVFDDAFAGVANSDKMNMLDFIYYSFVVLTTLGLGDIQPLHPIARSLTILEASVGVLFVAVLISSMVGAHASHQYRIHKKHDNY